MVWDVTAESDGSKQFHCRAVHTVFDAKKKTWEARELPHKPLLTWRHYLDENEHIPEYHTDITPDGKLCAIIASGYCGEQSYCCQLKLCPLSFFVGELHSGERAIYYHSTHWSN